MSRHAATATPAPPPAPAPAAPGPVLVTNPPSAVPTKKFDWKEILRELLISAGMDVAIISAWPMLRKIVSNLKAEHSESINEAKELFRKGEIHQGIQVLHRATAGVGMNDEQIEDFDFTAARNSHPKDTRLPGQLRSLETWLASNIRLRSAFRNSITLEPDWRKRIGLIVDYARLTDAERLQRLTAHGKLDPSVAEEVLQAIGQGLLITSANLNGRIAAYVAQDRTTWFNRLAKRLIR